MAFNLKTPGVYVEEISTFSPSVVPVETAIPAFIGYTEKHVTPPSGDNIMAPKRIKSLKEYEEIFGYGKPIEGVNVEIDESGVIKIAPEIGPADLPKKFLHQAMQAYFGNGGGPCYIVSIGGFDGEPVAGDFTKGIEKLRKEDEPTLIVFPEAVSLSFADYQSSCVGPATKQCYDLKDRFTICDVPQAFNDSFLSNDNLADFRTNGIGSNIDLIKYGACYAPYIQSTLDYTYADEGVNVTINFPEENGATPPPVQGTLADIKEENNRDYNRIIAFLSSSLKAVLPPSCFMAGVYAFVDNSRGVWKAPANVSLMNASKPMVTIGHDDQEYLNIDPTSGKSINAIRTFIGKGLMVWGARTLAGNDNEWRYIPVRRFFNFAEESIKKATERFVFEPNDANTWVQVKGMIANFLTLQWRAGALAGSNPDQAFFVNVGLGTTMTPQDILEGRMIVEIGMAVVRPAEFIILRFSHKMQES